MANVKIVLDKRNEKSDGTYPLYLRIIHNRESRNIPLGYSVSLKQWDEENKIVKNSYPNSKRVNLSMNKKLTTAQRVVIDNEDRLNDLSVEELKSLIMSFDSKTNSHITRTHLFELCEEVIKRLEKAKRYGSARAYKCCLSSFKKFTNKKDVQLSEVTYKFLIDYEAYCRGKGMSVNGIGNYLRSLRAVINLAIDEGLLRQEQYPFRKYRIKKEQTLKRAIPKEDIQKVICSKLPEGSDLWHSRNYFAFMFNMRGMNFIDLAYLRMDNLHDGRLIYRRIKTGKLYNIKITEQARQILNHYSKKQEANLKDFIFPIIPKEVIGNMEMERNRAQDKLKHFNQDLKDIAKICKIEINLTSYVIRHSWASIAKFSGIAPAVIGESLGHSDLKTTETYLAEFEHDVLDDANELIVS